LTTAIKNAVDRRHLLGPEEIFLIAEDELLSYAELQDRLGELIHGVDDWPTIRIPKAVAKAGAWVQQQLAPDDEQPFIKPWMIDLADAHYPVDATKAHLELDWRPKHTLSQTLPEMVRRLKQNPNRWYAENGLPFPEDTSEEVKET
jgi:nucleoside-diphosphate-sugar epimerase